MKHLKKILLLTLTIGLHFLLQGQIKTNDLSPQYSSEKAPSIVHRLVQIADSLVIINELDNAIIKLEESRKFIDSLDLHKSEIHGNILHLLGICWAYKGDLDKAEKNWKGALDIRKKLFGDQHEDVAKSYNNLGFIYNALGDIRKALIFIEKSLKIQIEIEGENNPILIDYYYNVGSMYKEIGQHNESLKYLFKSEELTSKNHGLNSSDLIQVYSSISSNYISLGNTNKAIEYQNKGLSLASKILEKDDDRWVDIYETAGFNLINIEEYGLALKYIYQLIEIVKTSDDITNKRIYANALSAVGIILDKKGDYKNSIKNYEKAVIEIKKITGSDNSFVAGVYNNLASIYEALGEIETAIQYLEKSLEIYLIFSGDSHPNIAIAYNNLGLLYNHIGNVEAAFESIFKSLTINKSIYGNEHPAIALSYMGLANIEESNNNRGKAIDNFKKAALILEKFENKEDLSQIYNNLGILSKDEKGIFESIYFFNKAKKLNIQALGEFNPKLIPIHENIGNKYFFADSLDRAIEEYESAINILNISIDSFKMSLNSYRHLISMFSNMGRAYRKKHLLNFNVEHLNISSFYYTEAIKLFRDRYNFLKSSSSSQIMTKIKDTFIGATSTNLLLFNLSHSDNELIHSFNYAERSKSFLLYRAMQENLALQIVDISDSLLKKEYDLRVDIAYYDKKRQEKLSAGLSETDTTVLEIASQLFDLNREYEALKERFEVNYPQYYKAKYDLSTVPLKTVQQEFLQPDQSLLEYMVGDSSIFLFLVQNDTFEVHEIKNDFGLDSLVNQMTKEGIYGYYTAPKSGQSRKLQEATIVNYTNAASKLYAKLIVPVEGRLKEKVIVVPDEVLGYLPFEALLSEKPKRMADFKNYPFLLKKHQISYCYSATLLKEMRDKQHRKTPTGGLFAVAPFYLDDVDSLTAYVDTTDILAFASLRDSLNKLNDSGKEVAAINKAWKGTALYGQDASLAEFQKNASDYRILHLSTHGKADDRVGDYAYLAFSMPNEKGAFEKLYARDLYNYSLNSDMVVLSACETGIGKLQKGEGIISLARAFAYAGAKSIFTTLWQVNDEKTKELMVAFYRHLKKGKEKDEALRLAKLGFLKKHEKKMLGGHPFFWAGMIGIGDMRSFKF